MTKQDDHERITDEVNYILDITADVCPMTFVKAKLLIERMASGEIAEILIRGWEPVENVPQSIRELGHEILAMVQLEEADPHGLHRLMVRKK